MHFPVKDRLENLFDPKTFKRIEIPSVPLDPIKFRDRKRYTDRLKEAQTTTGDQDAILVASGKMPTCPSSSPPLISNLWQAPWAWQ